MTRGRPVFGSDAGRAALEAVIRETLDRVRGPAKLVADVVAMRKEMNAHKPPSGPFDLKLGGGGLVDLEFAVHTLQLRHRIGLDQHLEVALAALEEAGLVTSDVDPALRLLTRMLVMSRLVAPTSAEPPDATKPLVAHACGHADWDSLIRAHDEARAIVTALWTRVRAD